jgi:hypothetical protein
MVISSVQDTCPAIEDARTAQMVPAQAAAVSPWHAVD